MKHLRILSLGFALALGLASCGGPSETSNSSSTQGSVITSSSAQASMASSYAKARSEFKAVSGVELPALADLEVDEYPYSEGDDSYCFDIIGGTALSFSTYQVFESFFQEKFGNCDEGYPSGDEANGRDAQWTTNQNRWFQTYWDASNKAIYINTTPKTPQPASNMTESYAEARTDFLAFAGLTLPELPEVLGMFEALGESMCMVDISGADENTLALVQKALSGQTSAEPIISDSGVSSWYFLREKGNASYGCEVECFLDTGIVVIMYEETLMEESFLGARAAFLSSAGIDLLPIGGLEADVMIGNYGYMIDLVGGSNLSKATYDTFVAYLNGLEGWVGADVTQVGSYPTMVYTNASSGASFQLVWNSESADGGIYINSMANSSFFDAYAASRAYLLTRFGFDMPASTGLSAELYCDGAFTCMTFDLTASEGNFTEQDYIGFVNAVAQKLGQGTDASDDVQKRTTWTVNNMFYDVVWDLASSIAINASQIQS